MNLMEQKNEMNRLKERIEQRLSRRFELMRIYGNLYFRKKDGSVFTLSKFPGEYAFVIEYAESYEDALIFRLEDGDLFYLEDMDEETMFQAMLQEIEQ